MLVPTSLFNSQSYVTSHCVCNCVHTDLFRLDYQIDLITRGMSVNSLCLFFLHICSVLKLLHPDSNKIGTGGNHKIHEKQPVHHFRSV